MDDEACRLRPYRDGDVAAVAHFFAAVHALDPSVAAPIEAAWRSFATRAVNHAGRDFALAEVHGVVAAVLTSTRLDDARHFRIIVHPAHRRRGIARALLDLVERQDEGAPHPLRSNCRGIWTAGRTFLERAGFSIVHQDRLMHRGRELPPRPPVPGGYTLRPYAGPPDHPAWSALSNEGFKTAFYFSPETAESVAGYTSVPGFGLWLATGPDGRAAGYCHIEHFGSVDGLVHSLVVAEPHRGRGLARALLVQGVRDLVSGGRERVELSVAEENVAARSLYASAGFVAYDEVITYERRAPA